ncbi:MAG: hypothetical protein ACPG5W_13030, partial [Flavobacteriales bacterium]
MKISRTFWYAFAFASLFQLITTTVLGQTDNDGNMRIYWYNDQVRTNNNDDWGTDEHSWYHYLRENADLGHNGGGWEAEWCDTRNCGSGCTQTSNNGWNVDPFPGGVGNTIPTQYRLRYRYWEDDRGNRCSYNSEWYGNNDDDHDDRTSNYNIRQGCPRVWTYYGWQGASSRNQHNSRSWYSPPRPNFARANGSSGTVTVCGPQNVTLTSGGKQCGSSRYIWYVGGTHIGTVNGSLTYYVSSNTTFTVYTRDNSGNSYSSRTVTVNVTSAPTANAGGNISQCSTANITTNGASATGSGLSYSWAWSASSGTAALSGASSLNGWTLNPSTNSGSGTLTLTVSSPGCP